MTETSETTAHAHRWVSLPVTRPVFEWRCRGCGETAAYGWNPEWAQDGLERYEEDLLSRRGGTVEPPEPALTLEQALELATALDGAATDSEIVSALMTGLPPGTAGKVRGDD